jgi:FixJ family two-component response regulator
MDNGAASRLRYDRGMSDARSPDDAIIAVVDDDPSMRSAVQGLLKAVGLQGRTFASAEEFLSSGQQHRVACLIADIRMPGMSGLDLQARLNAERIDVPIIFLTAHDEAWMRLQALRAGAVEFLAKPFNEEHLLDCVRAALHR